MRNIILFANSTLLLIFISCKTHSFKTAELERKIPAQFLQNGSANSTAIPNWKQIFIDSNLTALIDTALKNNFDLRSALQKIELSRSNVRLNKGIRLPEVSINGSIGNRKFGDYTIDGVGNFDTQFSQNINENQRIPNPIPDFYTGLLYSWEIDLWGKLKSKKEAATSRFIASEFEKNFIITSLIAEVAKTYFEIQAFQYETEILQENINLQQAALDLVISQKEAGKANQLGVEMMNAQLLRSKEILIEVRQELTESENKMKFLCGSFSITTSKVYDYFEERVKMISETGIPSDLLKNRPDIKKSELDLIACKADVFAAERAFYPSLNINGAIGLQSFKAILFLDFPASFAYNIFSGITAPIFNRRKLRADLMASKSEQKQAYIHYEKTVLNSFLEVHTSIFEVQNVKEMLELKKEEVKLLKNSILFSSELFKAGKATYLEVITAQKNTLEAQIELINLHKRQNNSITNLYRSLGGGWK